MSKFRPKKDRKHTQCPWCNSPEDTRTYIRSSSSKDLHLRLKPGHRNWTCGSSKRGQLPWQSRSCEVIVQEAKVENLELLADYLEYKLETIQERSLEQAKYITELNLEIESAMLKIGELEKKVEDLSAHVTWSRGGGG